MSSPSRSALVLALALAGPSGLAATSSAAAAPPRESRVVATPAPGVRLIRGALEWGDVPHVDWTLVDARGRRLTLPDDGAEPTMALSPDGRTLAIGCRGLTLVDLRHWRLRAVDGYTSPAYAPDGTLFVRAGWQYMYDEASPGQDAVFTLAQDGTATAVLDHAGAPPSSEPGMDAGSPAPVAFADGGRTLVATFARKAPGAVEAHDEVVRLPVGRP
ncbi:MAG: hypothetical protein U1F43_13065 [Myxococcota bacterium]